MYRNSKARLLTLLIPMLLLGSSPIVTQGAEPIVVVVSIYPLADMVRQIGGDRVEVVTLIPSGASPHTYEPTPSQMRAFSQARIFVRVGAGLELGLDRLTAVGRTDLIKVEATAGMELIGESGTGLGNPHVWLDPVRVIETILPAIAGALIETAADPADRVQFLTNLSRYAAEIDVLHREIEAMMDGLAGRAFISFHDTWAYFANRYGLERVAVVEPQPGVEPSVRQLSQLIEIARERDVRAILIEPQLDPRAARILAGEIGGQVVVTDPLGSPDHPDRDTYVELMRFNRVAFKEALSD
ncbi:MAG: metal ABC transporter substrate-binding protein [Candidatus Bipolaricaulia bacterium]